MDSGKDSGLWQFALRKGANGLRSFVTMTRRLAAMDIPKEIRCEGCGHLYATVEERESGFALHVHPPGLPIEPVNIAERLGMLVCARGHRTPVDLALLGER